MGIERERERERDSDYFINWDIAMKLQKVLLNKREELVSKWRQK